MKYGTPNAKALPATIVPSDTKADLDLFETLGSARAGLDADLLSRGALLFRGFNALDVPEFARFAREFAGRDLLDYVAGASPRVRLGGGVYTSTEYPSSFALSLHNELSYTFQWPELLFFCCV